MVLYIITLFFAVLKINHESKENVETMMKTVKTFEEILRDFKGLEEISRCLKGNEEF